MVTSTFDLFKIGVGPSSSHTMGPMTAAANFARRVVALPVARVEVRLYGSLALTGKGHASDRAILLGLAGYLPADIDPDDADATVVSIRERKALKLGGAREIGFDEASDLLFLQRERLGFHTNGMTFSAFDSAGTELQQRTYFSVGGGAVLDEEQTGLNAPPENGWDVPHVFNSGAALLARAADTNKSIAQLMRENEESRLSPEDVSAQLATIRDAMSACIDRGVRSGRSLEGPVPTDAISLRPVRPCLSREPMAARIDHERRDVLEGRCFSDALSRRCGLR